MDKDSSYICALTYLMEVDHLSDSKSGALHYTQLSDVSKH